jgi:charged multivesicular body protein 1
MGNKVSLEDEMINLRIVAKQMQRSAKKCEKNEKAALEKLKKVRTWLVTRKWWVCCFAWLMTHNLVLQRQAIQQGNSEGARIYGQDAIREKNQALNHLRMASRLDACCSRIETAVRMNQVTDGMKGVVKGYVIPLTTSRSFWSKVRRLSMPPLFCLSVSMGNSLNAMNIDQMSKLMDKFESQFEDLDVKTQYMEGTMNATTATSTPAEQVDELISRVADENNLELGEAFSNAGPVGKKTPQLKQPAKAEVQDDLEARLANLRN